MAGRSATTVMNRNGFSLSLSLRPFFYPGLLQRNLYAPLLEFHWLEIAIVSYIHIEYRRPFREFLGFRMEVPAEEKTRRGRERREKRKRQRQRRTRSFCTVTPPIPRVSGNASNAISSISFRFNLTRAMIGKDKIIFSFFEIIYIYVEI